MPTNPLKIVLQESEMSRLPIPMQFPDIAGSELDARHNSAWGRMPEIGFYRMTDCLVAEGGYVSDRMNGSVYDAEDLDQPWWRSKRQQQPPKFRPVRQVQSGGRTLIKLMNPGYRVYGHWLLDLLPSAWLLHQHDEAFKEGLPRWIIAEDTPRWAREMMNFMFGTGDDDFLLFEPSAESLSVDRLVVPSNLRVSPIMSSLFDGFVEAVLARSGQSNARRKIIISRANGGHISKRYMRNWREILDIAVGEGFEVLTPETLSWPEQVRAFRSASVVIGEYGSAIHSTLFSPSDCLIIALSPPSANQNQSAISALRGQTLQFVEVFDYQVDESGAQNFSVSSAVFRECLRRFAISPASARWCNSIRTRSL